MDAGDYKRLKIDAGYFYEFFKDIRNFVKRVSWFVQRTRVHHAVNF